MKFIKAIFVFLATKPGLLTAENIHPEVSSLRGTSTTSAQQASVPTDEAIGEDSRVLTPTCEEDAECDSGRCNKVLLPDGTEFGNLVCREKLYNDQPCKDDNDCRSGNCYEIYDFMCFANCLDGSGCSPVSLQPECIEENAACRSSCSLHERECRQGTKPNEELCKYDEESDREHGCNHPDAWGNNRKRCGKSYDSKCDSDDDCASGNCRRAGRWDDTKTDSCRGS